MTDTRYHVAPDMAHGGELTLYTTDSPVTVIIRRSDFFTDAEFEAFCAGATLS